MACVLFTIELGFAAGRSNVTLPRDDATDDAASSFLLATSTTHLCPTFRAGLLQAIQHGDMGIMAI